MTDSVHSAAPSGEVPSAFTEHALLDNAPRAGGSAQHLVGWFQPPVYPVRDGIYLVRTFSMFGPSECWHACRWHGASATWYAADTTGSRYEDSIGATKPNAHKFQWCGLSRAAQ